MVGAQIVGRLRRGVEPASIQVAQQLEQLSGGEHEVHLTHRLRRRRLLSSRASVVSIGIDGRISVERVEFVNNELRPRSLEFAVEAGRDAHVEHA